MVVLHKIAGHVPFQFRKFLYFRLSSFRGRKIIQLRIIYEERKISSQLGTVKLQLFIYFLHRLNEQELIRGVPCGRHILILKNQFPQVIINIPEGGVHLPRIKFCGGLYGFLCLFPDISGQKGAYGNAHHKNPQQNPHHTQNHLA